MTIQQVIGLGFICYGIIYAIWWIPKTIELRRMRKDGDVE